jgi:hypothetical protein
VAEADMPTVHHCLGTVEGVAEEVRHFVGEFVAERLAVGDNRLLPG